MITKSTLELLVLRSGRRARWCSLKALNAQVQITHMGAELVPNPRGPKDILIIIYFP